MKRVILAVCCIALGSFTVLAQKKAAEASAMTDQQFVDFAAQTDMVEANLGQLAQTAASSQPVKDYTQERIGSQASPCLRRPDRDCRGVVHDKSANTRLETNFLLDSPSAGT